MINKQSKEEVVFFDVDGTLINGNVQLSFLRFLRKKRIISFIQYSNTILQYVLYLIGFSSRLIPAFEQALSGLKGKTPQELQMLVENFIESNSLTFYSEAMTIIKKHEDEGKLVVLLTTISKPIANILAKHVGITDVIGTPLELKNGVYTGNLDGKIIAGKEKVVTADAYLKKNNLYWSNTWAYADSTSDVALLKKVAHPFAINPSSKMRVRIQHTLCKVLLFT